MNLFILHHIQTISCQQHVDRHVVKMILESAQILCTAHWVIDGEIGDGWYRPTHERHPVVRWCCENSANYDYVYRQFMMLSVEYEWRYGREHLSWTKLGAAIKQRPWGIDRSEQCHDFVLAMPDKYKDEGSRVRSIEEAVVAYRRYYLGEKRPLFTWTRRAVPVWVKAS